MRINYDEVIEVERLKRQSNRPGISRSNGYAVALEDEWFWFPAIEPAYAFGRAGRMSAQVGSWGLFEAATEARWSDGLRRDVLTLYVRCSGAPRDVETDRRLLTAFVDGVDPCSSYWRRR